MIVGALDVSSNVIQLKGFCAMNQIECSCYQNFCDANLSALVLAYHVNTLLTSGQLLKQTQIKCFQHPLIKSCRELKVDIIQHCVTKHLRSHFCWVSLIRKSVFFVVERVLLSAFHCSIATVRRVWPGLQVAPAQGGPPHVPRIVGAAHLRRSGRWRGGTADQISQSCRVGGCRERI